MQMPLFSSSFLSFLPAFALELVHVLKYTAGSSSEERKEKSSLTAIVKHKEARQTGRDFVTRVRFAILILLPSFSVLALYFYYLIAAVLLQCIAPTTSVYIFTLLLLNWRSLQGVLVVSGCVKKDCTSKAPLLYSFATT